MPTDPTTEPTRAGSGATLRRPPADVLDTTVIGSFVRWLERDRGVMVASYDELWRWSIDDLEGFWRAIWDYYGVRADRSVETVLASRSMPGAQWFPGINLNYAEHMIDGPRGHEDQVPLDPAAIALIGYSQTRERIALSAEELREQVARARTGLRRLGVRRGDRVVAYLPNIHETVVAFLAAASLGAVWASCSPEFGARAVIDRFGQLEPKVLLVVTGYVFGNKHVDRSAEVDLVRQGLPTLEHVVHVPYLHDGPVAGTSDWRELMSDVDALEFEPVPFDHPLYVLFSSGTTGVPKAIVHGHGGILLEHLKHVGLHWDTKPGDRLLWFTTTAWTMWNMLISGLLHRATVVLHDGNPLWPDRSAQWAIAESSRATLLGTSPAFVMACRKLEMSPARDHDLSELRTIGITGSPLPAEGFDWLYEQFADEVLVNSVSGGTDVCSGFVGGNPWSPIYRGEITGPCLAVDVAAFDAEGRAVIGELGELVVRGPMPSMPVRFWNDEGDARYRSSYFDVYPAVWRHGDWVEFGERGSCVISGRSDATLNRGGVRLGTAELYAVVDDILEVDDSVVVHLEDPSGATPGELLLFVAPRDGSIIDDHVIQRIRGALREQLSPRHVPDRIEIVSAVPRTLTGKRVEAPLKRILQGEPPDRIMSRESLVRPEVLDEFAHFHLQRSGD